MIEDIDRKFHSDRKSNGMNVALALIFDYERCNEYAKKIFENTNLEITTNIAKAEAEKRGYIFSSLFPGWLRWNEQYNEIKLFNDIKTKIEAAKSFIKWCVTEEQMIYLYKDKNKEESYRFIFWSLFILTVDKYNAEEYLSMICDFAKMLKITNEDFKSIIDLIKCIYNREGKLYEISRSNNFLATFCGLFDSYSDEYKL